MEDRRLLRLIKRARFGDKDAFCELIEEKSRKILFIATNLMGNSADGEDAAQEAIITLARKIGTLKKAQLFDAWMYRIVFNVCMDEKRKRKNKLDESGELDIAVATVAEKDTEVIPDKKLDDVAEKEEIMAAINELPDRYRMCMILFYYEDMSYAEIAQVLGVSEQVVANTLNRAKEKLRVSLSGVKEKGAVLSGAALSADDAVLEKEGSGTVPSAAVVKAGAFLPAAAITQAMQYSESVTVLPSAVAGLSGAAAAAVMPKGLIFSHLAQSVAAKAVAGVACAAVVVGGASYALTSPEVPVPEPTPIVKEAPEPEPVTTVVSARVEGLPEGSTTTILSQGQDDAELGSFKQSLPEYEFLTSLEEEGYQYELYRNIADPLVYVLTIEPIG